MRGQNTAIVVLSLACAVLMVLVYMLVNVTIGNRAEIGILKIKNNQLEDLVIVQEKALEKARAKREMQTETAQNTSTESQGL
jgi:hypothetical protein